MKKTNFFIKMITGLSFLFTFAFLTSCESNPVINVIFTTDNNEVTVGEYDLSKYRIRVDYKNGDSKEIVVDESMIDKNDIFKLCEVGTHDITFYYDNFYTTATFIVNANEFSGDIKFVTNGKYNDEDVFIQQYDGMSHSLPLTDNIPTDTHIIFPDGNSFKEAKNTPYEVRAILTKDGYQDKILTGKILIKVSGYPSDVLDEIVFEDMNTEYDGQEKMIEAINVPSDMSVEYKMYDSNGIRVENAVDAGSYTVNALFTLNNHNYILPDDKKLKTVTLTISKSPIDISSFSVEDIKKTYDGKSISIKTNGDLPQGVQYDIAIKNSNGDVISDPKDAGEYTVVLSFSCDKNHYIENPSISSKITINKNVIDFKDVTYGVEEVTYDGTEKSYSLLTGKLESFIKPNFTYYKIDGDEACTPIEAGKYRVVITYEIINENNNNFEFINVPLATPEQTSAILIIKSAN